MPRPEIDWNEAQLRDFVLGKLSADESERIEEMLIESRDFFEQVEAIEAELFDDFVRGALPAEDREAFQRRYGDEKSRMSAAVLLARKSERPSNVRRFAPPQRVLLAAAAVVLVALSAAVLLRRGPTKAPSVAQSESARVVPQPQPGRVITLALVLATTRDARGIARVSAQAGDTIEAAVRLNPADRYSGYAATVRGTDGRIVWSGTHLPATMANGELVLRCAIPPNACPPGEYRLRISGESPDSTSELLGEVHFAVSRPSPVRAP